MVFNYLIDLEILYVTKRSPGLYIGIYVSLFLTLIVLGGGWTVFIFIDQAKKQKKNPCNTKK